MKFLLLILMLFITSACSTQISPSAQTVKIPELSPTATPQSTAPTPVLNLLSESDSQSPVALEFPTLQRTILVTPMTWQVLTINGERKAEWQIPLEGAGWHPNSTKPGSAGTVIISGHHHMGSAVFAPIAQGGVQQGQDIIVKDAANRRWIYRVVIVLKPIPVEGATAEEKAQLEDVLTATDQPRLVLLTGWPEFSDTHYVAVLAELVG